MSITLVIVIVTSIVSIMAFQNEALMNKLIMNPYVTKHRNQWYRFITSGIIHADWLHLLINMFVFYSFGKIVEQYYDYYFGELSIYYFLMLYFGSMIISILPSYVKHHDQPHYNSLGASGAVSAIVFAYIIFDPLSNIYLYGLIGIPGIVAALLYLIYSWYMAAKGGDNINHSAHLWGAIFGFVYTIILKPDLFIDFIDQLRNVTGL
ncbi:MAG: rhomboid family intramembrane serine protease [Bacteroidia bacterium]